MHPKQLVQMVILQLKLLTILHHIIEDNKCIMYYTKIKFTLIMLSVISCVGCKSLSGQDAQTDDTSVVDILIFKNNEEVIEGKYSVIKEFVKDEVFVLKNNGDIFFEVNGYTNLASS